MLTRDTYVFYAARRPGDDPFAQQLRVIADSTAISLKIVYSQATAAGSHSLGPRRLRAEDIVAEVGHTDIDAMVCGPASMVAELPRDLAALGVPPQHITVEAFGGTVERPTIVAPKGGHLVTFAASRRHSRWYGNDQTLLELAEDIGVQIPSSCRSGACGTCQTQVLSGKVAHLIPPGIALAPDHCLPCIGIPSESVELAK